MELFNECSVGIAVTAGASVASCYPELEKTMVFVDLVFFVPGPGNTAAAFAFAKWVANFMNQSLQFPTAKVEE
jgi:hypothetical protein